MPAEYLQCSRLKCVSNLCVQLVQRLWIWRMLPLGQLGCARCRQLHSVPCWDLLF